VYDVCDNGKQFDPVLSQVRIGEAGMVRQIYSRIPAAEHFVRVANGKPGLSRVKLMVNGWTFEVNPLGEGQAVVLDVRAAMNEGDQNTIVFLGWGVPGASAELQIADRATDVPLVLAAKVEPPHLAIDRVGDQVVLTWLGPANFFILESSDSLGPQAVWQAVTAHQEEAEGFTTVRLRIQGDMQVFRLRQ
jgi:hypothetical protein